MRLRRSDSSGDGLPKEILVLSISAGHRAVRMRRQFLACKSIDRLISDSENPKHKLAKSLGPWSLTALGIGAIIGSGIFVLTGTAAAGEHFESPSYLHAQVMDLVMNLVQHGNLSGALLHGRPAAGPAIAISFILVAVACSFAGLCYAELASMIPIAGSAYTYCYATLGEIVAWIIGWDLILEYAVSNVAVAVGFGGYLKAQLSAFGVDIPDKWSTPVWEAGHMTGAYFDFPAFLVIFVLTILLVRGMRESARANNVMVVVKIGAIITFLVVGGMLVKPDNWHPFAPSGFAGVLSGGAIIFFTYIGFDAVSTAAEESGNPQRDMPIGIIASLIVCAVLYIGVALVLLGMMRYTEFGSGPAADAPVAYALKALGAHPFFLAVIVIGALTGMVSSILVFQYGQARIWFAMSRDRLLPGIFSAVHPRFKTPHWSTWIARGCRDSRGPVRHRGRGRPVEHRDALRLRPRVPRCHHPSQAPAWAPPRLQGSIRAPVPDHLGHPVRRPHDGPDRHHVDPVLRLARYRPGYLFRL
jgi:basic amino acid/polyamine antiporter, APA family